MRIFILEDDKGRICRFGDELMKEHDITVCTSVKGALKCFAPPYDLMLLDHDLGGETFVPSEKEETGYSFLQQLPVREAIKRNKPIVIVHSFNYQGAQRMVDEAGELGARSVMRIPFGEALFVWVRRVAELWKKLREEPTSEEQSRSEDVGSVVATSAAKAEAV